MDPTLAALLGAGIGSVTTVIAAFATPLISSGRAHKARRRDLMREDYASGMRTLISATRIKSRDEYSPIKQELFEALEYIRLVGSRRAADKFNLLLNATALLADSVGDESGEGEVDDAQAILTKAHDQFMLCARKGLRNRGSGCPAHVATSGTQFCGRIS